ncbi:MAG: type II toxin-antitoxin system prevent-host-death family antitoxin [Pseudomonadota bacterium]
MTRVTATEFKNNLGAYSDAAMSEPVIVTSHNRDRLVLLSAEEYKRLTDAATNAATTTDHIDQILQRHKATILDLADR